MAKRNKVFVDSSVLIAATLSHAGGSFYLLAEKLINKDDAPILAGAMESCLYLLTPDNHFLTENILKFAAKSNLSILKPKDFLEQYQNFK